MELIWEDLGLAWLGQKVMDGTWIPGHRVDAHHYYTIPYHFPMPPMPLIQWPIGSTHVHPFGMAVASM